jgi:flagellar basal body-associated protein FliL
VSIVFASQVNPKYNKGDYEGAEKSSKIAKISWIVAIVTIVAILAWTIFVVGTSWDEFMETFNAELEKQKALQQ